jgi:hypothetical protein
MIERRRYGGKISPTPEIEGAAIWRVGRGWSPAIGK